MGTGGFGGLKRGLSFRLFLGKPGHKVTAAACRPARRAAPVTRTAPRAACWPGARWQVTWNGRWAVAPGFGPVAWPPAVGALELGPPAGGAGEAGLAGPGAGVVALPAVKVIDRPAAARATSPGDIAVTDGTVPVVIRVMPR